jgi:transposase
METSIAHSLSVSSSNATLLVALELSKATWVVALSAPLSDRISHYSIAGGDAGALLKLIEQARSRAEAALGQPVRVVCCYEAGYDGFWLHRVLTANGIDNHVLDAASLLVNRRARRAKTDRIDVDGLIRALAALVRGERHACRAVHVPSVEDEDRRRQTRERERLVAERTAHVNRIKGLLMAQGIRDFLPTRPNAAERLAELRTGDGRPLSPCLAAEIRRELRRLKLVEEMIGEVETERDSVMAGTVADQRIALLRQVKGIGPVAATVLGREVFHREFTNRRELASYLGLTPSPWASGSVQLDQGISKAGNARARTILIEIAWLWPRYQPGSRLAGWFRERVGQTKGRLRRILVVALARKLVVALWRYLGTGVIPEGVELRA